LRNGFLFIKSIEYIPHNLLQSRQMKKTLAAYRFLDLSFMWMQKEKDEEEAY